MDPVAEIPDANNATGATPVWDIEAEISECLAADRIFAHGNAVFIE